MATEPDGTRSFNPCEGENSNLLGRVLSELRYFIEQKHLHPGMKLPPERTLAKQLKVGRPTIREAIKALSILDILESRRGDGTYVKSLAGLTMGLPTAPVLKGSNFDMLELLEVRKMVEPHAAALAAARAGERKLNEMERNLRAQEENLGNYDVLARLDYLFHEAIIHAAGNKVLNDVARLLTPFLVRSREVTWRTTDSPIAVKEHRTIFEAIRLGQSDLAERVMREHLQRVGVDLIGPKKR